ncbi:MAG: TIGR02530 family flagellar biosynthesis protein [Halanaerobiaceae bacterium]
MVDDRMIVNQPITSPQKSNQANKRQRKTSSDSKQVSFEKVLKDKLNKQKELKFSHHAEKRMLSRGIEVSEKNLQQLTQAVDKAEEKGSKDSLIMVDEVAYLVSIENRTVVTAVDDESMRENVFTNIDSAVVM